MKKGLLFLFALALMLCTNAFAQSTISGKVTSTESGEALIGVSVSVKGTTTGTATDIDGNYTVEVPDGAKSLVFSFVGFAEQTVQIGTQSTINVTMKLDNNFLEEVIVTAYGEQSKKALTGAVGVVGAETIKNQQVISVGRALQGTTPGVNIITGSGQPGENPTIRIRGISSINASAEPLIVLDGIVFNGNLSSIDPNDIESLNVLKDASSSALYGSRAANGVILITTKSGTVGQTRIDVSASYGISQRAVPEYEFLNAEEYMSLAWESLKFEGQDFDEANPGQYASDNLIPALRYNPYGTGLNSPVDANGNISGTPLWDTDWEELLSRDQASRQNVSMSISGGEEKMKYYFSGNYINQEGLTITSKFERINTRLNVDVQPKKWIMAGIKTAFSYSDQNFPNQDGTAFANNIQYIRSMSNIYPLYVRDESGNIVNDADGNPVYDFGSAVPGKSVNSNRLTLNPSNLLASTTLNDLRRERTISNINGYTELFFLKDFSFRSNFGLDYYVYNRFDYDNPDNGDGQNVGGRAERQRNLTTAWTWFNKLSYNKTIDDHRIGVDVIQEAYNYKYEYFQARKTSFPFNGLKEFDAASSLEALSSYTNSYRLASILGKASYSFKDRYFFDASVRSDASSKFSKDNRQGLFYSVGASWVLSDENFLKSVSLINNLKLRASFGELGNDNLLDAAGFSIYFPYADVYSVGYPDGSNPGIFLSRMANQDISWEKVQTFNIGLDFSILKNRLSGTVEWYSKKTGYMLFGLPLPFSSGFPTIDQNIGDMKNTGLEVLLHSENVRTEDLSWTTDFNISFEKNEILSLPQDEIINGSKKLVVGRSVYDFFIQEWAGVDPEDGAAMWYMDEVDAEGNVTGKVTTKEYDEADRYFSEASSLPDARGGLTNTVNYKGFQFSALLAYSIGGSILNTDYSSLMHGFNDMGDQLHIDMLKRWQEPGDVTDVPRLNTGNSNVNDRSTRFLIDNTFLRVRNITLGYDLKQSGLIKTNSIRSLRIFLQGDNLFTFSKLDGMDPEQNIQGTTSNRSAIFKTYSAGLNIGF